MEPERTQSNKRIAFLFPAFPVLHQTFVLWEVLALRQHGIDIEIYSIKRPSTRAQQPEARELAREVHYLPRTRSAAVLGANLRALLRTPHRYFGAFAKLACEWWRDRQVTSLWTDGSKPRSPSLEAAFRRLTLRSRVDAVLNTNPILYLFKSWLLVFQAVYLGEKLREREICLLHSHWASYPATMALVIRWVFGIPFSFSAHAYDIYLVPRLLPIKVRTAQFTVTCAKINGRYLRELGGPEAAERVTVNYHGVDLERFCPRGEAERNEEPLIVTCGRLQLYKGHHVLIEASARLKTPVRCVIIGEGPRLSFLESVARDLGIDDRVVFTGPLPQSEVADYYARADLFVLASLVVEQTGRRDVIPNVLVEAMAMEIPVVATDMSGISELVEDGVSGRLVTPNDAGALASVIEELLGDEEQCRRLARGGLQKVRAEFDRSTNVLALVDLFREHSTERVTSGLLA